MYIKTEYERDLSRIFIENEKKLCRFYILILKHDNTVPNRIREPLYVGSTTLTLKKRLQCYFNEVKDFNRTDKKNECIRKYGINNWEIVLVKEVICTRQERFMFEERVIDMMFPSLNERDAFHQIWIRRNVNESI